MAYLNVRERRIEARVAYVGPPSAGKSATLERLRRTTGDARVPRVDAGPGPDEALTVMWIPTEGARFRDCDFQVKVTVPRDAGEADKLPETLGEVDGIVLVVDASPLAQAKNRASLAAVRACLRRPGREGIAVVLQINKVDLPDALPTANVLSGLEVTDFPHVAASASNGQGVVDALDVVLKRILGSMQRDAQARSDAAPGQQAASPETGHPLLAALRQLLRDTVREHLVDVEARLNARIDATLRPLSERLDAVHVVSSEARAAVGEIAELLMEVSHRTTALTDRAHATLEAVRRLDASPLEHS